MYHLIILPSAKKDIKKSAVWYNEQKAGLGREFTKELRNKIAQVKINPFAYSFHHGDIRTCILKRFPFMIHFKIDEAAEIIILTGVLHTSLHPKIWDKRS